MSLDTELKQLINKYALHTVQKAINEIDYSTRIKTNEAIMLKKKEYVGKCYTIYDESEKCNQYLQVISDKGCFVDSVSCLVFYEKPRYEYYSLNSNCGRFYLDSFNIIDIEIEDLCSYKAIDIGTFIYHAKEYVHYLTIEHWIPKEVTYGFKTEKGEE